MKFRATSPLLLLLLPSIAGVFAQGGIADTDDEYGASIIARQDADTLPPVVNGRHEVPTKDAPVDGRDGKPHLGPFVGSEVASEGVRQELPPLKGRPDDPTVVDGRKIPESNDGVMFDKNRDRPQEGTTGTEGGVSEKDKARKAQEGRTGEKVVTQPESPKEPPPLPHSEAEKLAKDGTQTTGDKDDSSSYTGLDKPERLPQTPHEVEHPMPDSAKKDPLDLSGSHGTYTKPDAAEADEENEGLYQPFHSFVLSFTMILVSEIGDKTFLVACLMAMKHDRMVVFSAAFGALLVMTVLSAVLGHAVPALISRRLTSFLAAGLFLVFGARLLKEGMDMDPNEGVSAEMHEVEQELAEKEKELGREGRGSVSQYNLEMGLGGPNSRPRRYDSPPGSPSLSPVRKDHPSSNGVSSFFKGAGNLFSLLLSPAWVQTFAMTFLGEWGDRSQIATIAMAAGQDYWWVALGASCGHAICTGVAVIGGRAIAGRVSLKAVTMGGAIAFLVFGVLYLLEAIWG